ncbi:thioredoxin [Yinghuangia seranimata]|uniref:thioredoxin n=1 Tax=Yinghuangia seranimata TaxID=408067 RepID=UPI00248BAF95|nr:thioredoxin [Yinghuangia seranimata]MDI2129198.1 thioredoxin [Yinghuangia seranimata]
MGCRAGQGHPECAGSPHRSTARQHSRRTERHMATVELTKDNFDEVVSGDGLTVIDFWAAWCGPCRQFAPTFERVSEHTPDVVFAKVDTEAQPELAAAFSISSIPTIMLVRDNVMVYAQPGALPEAALVDLISQAQNLDMGEVKRKVAEQQATAQGQSSNGDGPQGD